MLVQKSSSTTTTLSLFGLLQKHIYIKVSVIMTGTQLFRVKGIHMTRGEKLTIREINKEEIITQLPEGIEAN